MNTSEGSLFPIKPSLPTTPPPSKKGILKKSKKNAHIESLTSTTAKTRIVSPSVKKSMETIQLETILIGMEDKALKEKVTQAFELARKSLDPNTPQRIASMFDLENMIPEKKREMEETIELLKGIYKSCELSRRSEKLPEEPAEKETALTVRISPIEEIPVKHPLIEKLQLEPLLNKIELTSNMKNQILLLAEKGIELAEKGDAEKIQQCLKRLQANCFFQSTKATKEYKKVPQQECQALFDILKRTISETYFSFQQPKNKKLDLFESLVKASKQDMIADKETIKNKFPESENILNKMRPDERLYLRRLCLKIAEVYSTYYDEKKIKEILDDISELILNENRKHDLDCLEFNVNFRESAELYLKEYFIENIRSFTAICNFKQKERFLDSISNRAGIVITLTQEPHTFLLEGYKDSEFFSFNLIAIGQGIRIVEGGSEGKGLDIVVPNIQTFFKMYFSNLPFLPNAVFSKMQSPNPFRSKK